jgi:hypothetical protein
MRIRIRIQLITDVDEDLDPDPSSQFVADPRCMVRIHNTVPIVSTTYNWNEETNSDLSLFLYGCTSERAKTTLDHRFTFAPIVSI